MTILARARVVLEGDSVALTRELQGASRAMRQAGDKMGQVGRSLTLRLTAPIVGAGTAAARLASGFEAEMSKIVGLVGVAQDQVDDWARDILDLAPRLGAAPRELAEGLFFVTSAGLRGAEAMEVLEAAAKGSAAGLGDIATIADLSTSAMNAYGSEALSAGEATDILTAAVREGKLAPEELAGSMGQVIPVASAMGIRFDEVGAAMAAMSRTGTNAAVAATQLRQIMVSLLKPSEQAETALAEMGLSAADLRQQIREKGLLSVLQTLAARFEGNDEAAAQVFGNIRALAGVMDLMGSSADNTAAIFASLEDATGSLDGAFEAASDTARFRMAQSLAELQVVLLRLGDQILPAIASAFAFLVRQLVRVSDVFTGMPRPLQLVSLGLVGLAAAIGPVLVGLASLVSLTGLTAAALTTLKVPALTAAFVAWAKGIAAATVAAKGLLGTAIALKAVFVPIGWLLAAGAAVALLARRFRAAGEEARQATDAADGYADSVGRMSQAAREFERTRLEEALRRQKDALADLKAEQERVGAATIDRSLDPRVRAEAIAREKEIQAEIRIQSEFVERLEGQYRAVNRAIRDGASEQARLNALIDDLGGPIGGGGIVEPVREALQRLQEDLEAAARKSDVLGDGFDLAAARASAFGAAVDALAETSVDLDAAITGSGQSVRDLAAELLALEEANLRAAEETRKLKAAQDEIRVASETLADSLAQNEALTELLGDRYDTTAEKAAAFGRAVRALVAAGVDFDAVVGPQGETLRELADRYVELAAAADLARQQETRASEARQDAVSELDVLGDALQRTGERGVQAFADFAVGAGRSMSDFVRRAIADLARLAARIIAVRALSSFFPGLGLASGGGRSILGLARGGRARRGEPVFVGEEGVELFVPDTAGQVFSASDTRRILSGAPSSPVASSGGGGAATLRAASSGSQTVRFDFSGFPAATNPLSAARDDQWQRFLRESERVAASDGFDPRRP